MVRKKSPFSSCLTCLLVISALGQAAIAKADDRLAKPAWVASPGGLRQTNGKFPPTVTLMLFRAPCERNADGSIKKLDPTDIYNVTPTGTVKVPSRPVVGDCWIRFSLNVDPSSEPGLLYLSVSKQAKGTGPFVDDSFAPFILFDATAGPTPSTPEVNVTWKVLSQQACSDGFGNRVAKVFYCVQVTVGNNSAHKLQISGIGFKTPHPLAGQLSLGFPRGTSLIEPNVSYQTTRAVAQNGQVLSTRNLLYRSFQSLGLIMASFTPFFRNSFNNSRWATGSSIVSGAFVQAIGLVAPDLTIRELNSLDDQSLRDGKLIPNNTQAAPVMVFVDKTDATDALRVLEG